MSKKKIAELASWVTALEGAFDEMQSDADVDLVEISKCDLEALIAHADEISNAAREVAQHANDLLHARTR